MTTKVVRPEHDPLDRIELHRVRLPLREPFVAAHGTELVREVVLVEVVGLDGVTGWGECSALSRPGYTAEHVAGAWSTLRDDLGPGTLIGRPLEVGACPMAWSAIECALLDRRGRASGEAVAGSLGGTRRDVEVTAVLGRRDEHDALLAAVAAQVSQGIGSVKLKVVPGDAVEAVRLVRSAFPDLLVAVDANGSFDAADPDHRNQLVALDRAGVWYLEQPLSVGADHDLVALARSLDAAVALDESIGGLADLQRLATPGVPFVVNVKPARVGGLHAAWDCVQAAGELDWSCFVGGMLETGVGRAAALVAASWAECDLPTDLGPSSRYFFEDVTDPIELVDGQLPVPTGPGLGVEVHRDRVVAARVDHAVVRP